MNDKDYINELSIHFDHIKETSLSLKKFKYSDIMRLINNLKSNELLKIDIAGNSLDGETIFKINLGKGPVKILIWSQMHGNEPTATMALFDFFNFIQNFDALKEFKERLLKEITFTIIPVLNPDGMKKFQRENLLGIDLNRDATALQFPESKILMSLWNEIKPDFCFNLHDQSPRYSVGRSGIPTAIALLVPPFDFQKSLNGVREAGMKVIADINNSLQKIIPGQVARYEDDFEPRAFGDNFVKLGSTSILIEAGNIKDDPEKQTVRKLFFLSLLTGFKSIIDKSFIKNNIEDYFSIPQNEEIFFDLLVKNAAINKDGKKFVVDIGINRKDFYDNTGKQIYYKSNIEEIGDLSVYFGNEEIDLAGYDIFPGEISPGIISLDVDLTDIDFESLYKNGYLALRKTEENSEDFHSFPINILCNRQKTLPGIEPDNPANIVIKKANKIEYIILNGFIYKIGSKEKSILNGIIFH